MNKVLFNFSTAIGALRPDIIDILRFTQTWIGRKIIHHLSKNLTPKTWERGDAAKIVNLVGKISYSIDIMENDTYYDIVSPYPYEPIGNYITGK